MLNIRLTFICILVFSFYNFTSGQISNSLAVNANDIYAMVRNDGSLFWDGNKSVFKVPFQGSSTPTTIFTGNLMVLALDENNKIFLAGDEYQGGYLPGPLYDGSYSTNDEHTQNFNQIWSVDYISIQNHIADFLDNGQIDKKANSIYSWPGKGNPHFKQYNGFEPYLMDYDLAPFHDQNGDGIYNPDKGDYPEVSSIDNSVTPELITWCIFNNVQNDFRLEVGLTCWAMQCDNNPILNKSFFCSYKIANKSTFKLKEVRAAIFIDPDLGCYNDDYVGSIPGKNASFWYNADSIDGNLNGKCDQSIYTYGDHPPVQSLVFLNHAMDVLMNFNYPSTQPNTLQEYFNYFNAISLINEVTGLPAKHAYSDNPNDKNGWSMYALKFPIGDQRLFNVAAIGDLGYNQNASLDLTYIYHNDPDSNHVQNVNVAYDQIDQMHLLYANGFKNSCSNSHCANDCVWTGDTNNDGIVNYLDAVNIFKGYLDIETDRKNVWIWKGQESASWSKNFVSGLNYKYADANGDAIINETDLEPLKIYHDFKHGDPIPNTFSCDEGDDFTWKITRNDSILKTIITFQITLDAPVKNFQGISFEIPIEPEFLTSVLLSPKSIWQDTAVKLLSYIENAKDPFDKSIIKAVYFNKTKNDEQASLEVNWSFTIQRNNGGNFPAAYYDLKVCNGKLYLNDGSIILLKSRKIRIYKNPVIAVDEIDKDSLYIYPQPASNQIVISKPELVNSWKLYTMHGRLLKTKQTQKSESLFNIDFLDSGSYFIELNLDQRKIMQRIIVMRR